MSASHIPVLLEEIKQYLGGLGPLVDCTTGAGGHLRALLAEMPTPQQVLAIDRDRDMLKVTQDTFPEDSPITFVHGRFSDIEQYIKKWGHQPKAILADLGVSSMQLDQTQRGFSLQRDAPLDMRMDRTQTMTAGKLLGRISEKELREALREESDEKKATVIARRLKAAVDQGQIRSTLQLANLVREVVGQGGRIDPATRTFQTIRRLVNEEGRQLEFLLEKAPEQLLPGGRLAVISFHSGEDRVVKNQFNIWASRGGYKVLTSKPLASTESECRENPRSRSARLRVLEKAA